MASRPRVDCAPKEVLTKKLHASRRLSLPYPNGHETTGYEVAAVAETLAKAKASGATILVEPYQADGRDAAIVEFPGGYIAEIHSSVK